MASDSDRKGSRPARSITEPSLSRRLIQTGTIRVSVREATETMGSAIASVMAP